MADNLFTQLGQRLTSTERTQPIIGANPQQIIKGIQNNISIPETTTAGQSIYGQTPTSSTIQTPSVLTSKLAKDITNNNISYLSNLEQGLGQTPTTITPTTQTTIPTTTYGTVLNVPTSATNPAQNQLVNNINQTISSLTPEQKQTLLTSASGELLNRINQSAGTELSLTTQARNAEETGNYYELNQAIKGIQESQNQRIKDLQALQEQITPLRQQLMTTFVPTAEETQISTQIADLQQRMADYDIETQRAIYNLEGQGRGIVAGLVSGQQAKLQQQRALSAQSMAAQEQNLLTRLGLMQEARQAQQTALTSGISALTQDYELQSKVQDIIDTQNQSIIDQASELTTQAKDMLTFVLEQFQGVDYDSLPEESKQTIGNLATQAGLDIGLIQAGLKAVADQQAFDNQIELMKEYEEPESQKLLSPTEAANLGVPYGTTRGEAYGIIPKSTTGLPYESQKRVDKISDTFDSNQIVKDFVELQNKKLSIDSIIDSGVGGPGDLALVFEFMKALDPTSVVRESEYEAAAKSGNIFKGAFARFNGYLKAEGGFLPDQVKESFRKISDEKYNIKKQQYDNYRKEQANKIDKITGSTDGSEYLTDYVFESTNQAYTKNDEDYVNQIINE